MSISVTRSLSTVHSLNLARSIRKPAIGELAGISIFLIGPDQLDLSEYVTLHRLFELRFVGLLQVRQHDVQCIEFVEIAVPADRWTWAAVATAFPVVQPMLYAFRQFGGLDAFFKASDVGWNIVNNPVDPGELWRCRIGSIRVVNDKRQTFSRRW